MDSEIDGDSQQRAGCIAPVQATPGVETGTGAGGGVGGDSDYYDSEEYQAFVAECAKHCRCTHTVCAGVLAGGFCDELIEDDQDEENYDRDEDDD